MKQFAALCGLLVLLASIAESQSTIRSSIAGTVTDSTGARIPDASVVVTDLDRKQTYTTLTNAVGSTRLRT
jgi:hypothetical protein